MRATSKEAVDVVGVMHLRLVDPARNRLRVYCLAESESLFGEPSLFITWGRIGHQCRVRIEVFPDREALARRRRELLARRRRHGYSRVSKGEFAAPSRLKANVWRFDVEMWKTQRCDEKKKGQ
jgi:predicted DNA-binding WGR domain protein